MFRSEVKDCERDVGNNLLEIMGDAYNDEPLPNFNERMCCSIKKFDKCKTKAKQSSNCSQIMQKLMSIPEVVLPQKCHKLTIKC